VRNVKNDLQKMIFRKKRTAILISSLLAIFVIIKFTGVLSTFNIVENTMAPDLMNNSSIVTTNLADPNLGNLIVFKSKRLPEPSIFRIVAKEGDTLRIENGTVYRNGKNIDTNLSLVHTYALPMTKIQELKKSKLFYDDFGLRRKINLDTVVVDAVDNLATSLNLLRMTNSKDRTDSDIRKVYSQNWNKDNFGPLVIKKNKFFVLGDNRDNSYDSRFIGLIDKTEIIGIKIFQF